MSETPSFAEFLASHSSCAILNRSVSRAVSAYRQVTRDLAHAASDVAHAKEDCLYAILQYEQALEDGRTCLEEWAESSEGPVCEIEVCEDSEDSCCHHHEKEEQEHECCGGHGHHHEKEEHECCGGHGHHHEKEEHECCGGHGHHQEEEEPGCCGGHGLSEADPFDWDDEDEEECCCGGKCCCDGDCRCGCCSSEDEELTTSDEADERLEEASEIFAHAMAESECALGDLEKIDELIYDILEIGDLKDVTLCPVEIRKYIAAKATESSVA